MSRHISLMVLISALTLVPTASAGERPSIVAVFNIESKGVSLPSDVIERLSDYLTGRMGEGGRFLVVPRDRIKESLTRQKTASYQECYAQSCQIELGMELAANKTLATQVIQLGSQCKVNLALFDLAMAATENSATASGACTTDGIVASLDVAVGRLLGLNPLAPPVEVVAAGGSGQVISAPPEVVDVRPQIRGGVVTAVFGDLTVQGKTRAGTPVRLEVTDPSGQITISGSPFKDARAKIGTWIVVAKASGHEEETRKIQVPADDIVIEKIELIPFGALKISGEPAGAIVSVSGPAGFVNEGGLPWEADGLRNGQYRVKVSREGYDSFETSQSISEGNTAQVFVRLIKKPPQGEYREGYGPGWGFSSMPKVDDQKWGWIRVTSPYAICGVEDSVDEHRQSRPDWIKDHPEKVDIDYRETSVNLITKYYKPPMYFRVTPGKRSLVVCFPTDSNYGDTEVFNEFGIKRVIQNGEYNYELVKVAAGEVKEVRIDGNDPKEWTCYGSCPWVYVVQGDKEVKVDEILKDVKGRSMKRWADLTLPGTKGLQTITVRIAEEIKGETTFLDAVRVSSGSTVVGPSGATDEVRIEDEQVIKMPFGESMTLTFELPEPAVNDVVLQANGYYEVIEP